MGCTNMCAGRFLKANPKKSFDLALRKVLKRCVQRRGKRKIGWFKSGMNYIAMQLDSETARELNTSHA